MLPSDINEKKVSVHNIEKSYTFTPSLYTRFASLLFLDFPSASNSYNTQQRNVKKLRISIYFRYANIFVIQPTTASNWCRLLRFTNIKNYILRTVYEQYLNIFVSEGVASLSNNF